MTELAMFLLGFVSGAMVLVSALGFIFWRMYRNAAAQVEEAQRDNAESKRLSDAIAVRIRLAAILSGRTPPAEADEESAN